MYYSGLTTSIFKFVEPDKHRKNQWKDWFYNCLMMGIVK